MDTFTKEELEYQQEYEACLNDGQISTSERRLLDRLAKSLGLSKEQINKIESAVNNPLSEPEKEYLEEYRACLSDDPDISPSTRRLLNRLASSLNLTEEQVNKIEKLVLPSNNEEKVVPPPIPTQNSNEEIKKEDTCDPDADFSIAYLKGDILTVCIAGTGQVITLDIGRFRNKSLSEKKNIIDALRIDNPVTPICDAGVKFLMSNMMDLQNADSVYFITCSHAKSMKEAMRASNIFRQGCIFRETTLFGFGKLAEKNMSGKEGKHIIHYLTRELVVDVGDGVFYFMDERDHQSKKERDLYAMLLGLILELQILNGDLKDNLVLENFGHDLTLTLSVANNQKEKLLFTIDTTIPAKEVVNLESSHSYIIGLSLDDVPLIKEVALPKNSLELTFFIGSHYGIEMEITNISTHKELWRICNFIK